MRMIWRTYRLLPMRLIWTLCSQFSSSADHETDSEASSMEFSAALPDLEASSMEFSAPSANETDMTDLEASSTEFSAPANETDLEDSSVVFTGSVNQTDSGASSSASYCCHISIGGFTYLTSMFNGAAIALTLESYALVLRTPQFLLCFCLLVIKPVIYFTITPYWTWIENRSGHADQGSTNTIRPSDKCKAGAVFLQVVISICLIFTVIYDRQGLGPRQTKTLLLVGISIILFEGIPHILLVREEFKSFMRNPWVQIKEIPSRIRSEGHDWEAVKFLTPSVINSAITTTSAIVLGGNTASQMSQIHYWCIILMGLIDLLAEFIHRYDFGNRFPSTDPLPYSFPKRHYIGVVLRLFFGGFMCFWTILQKVYIVSNMNVENCNKQCQERSEMILIIIVALTGVQAAGTFTIPACSFLLGPEFIPSVLFHAMLLFGYLVLLPIWLIAKLVSVVVEFFLSVVMEYALPFL